MDRIFSVTLTGLGAVLLMVAMAVTPMSVCRAPVDYPFARSASRYVGTERDFPVTIKADDTIYVGQDYVRADELEKYLQTVCRITERPIVIRSDRQATTGAVRNVLAAVATAGVRRVTIMTASPEAP